MTTFTGPVGRLVRQQRSAAILSPERSALTRTVAPQGVLLPHYRTFGSIFNTASRVYSSRWDEAIRASRANAKAMLRDAYHRSLIQERVTPLRRWKWAVESADGPDKVNPKDPRSADRERIRNGLEDVVRRTWKLNKLRRYLGLALWYGRYGSQLEWQRKGGRFVVGRHWPVNGDKIQTSWDGFPCVAINSSESSRFERGDLAYFDGGYQLLRLEKPEYRTRFVIHSHEVEDADFWDGDQAGRVDGIGLRDFCYWAWWLRDEMLSWLTDFMEKVGNLGIIMFWFEDGNAASKAAAETAAAQANNRNAIAAPRVRGKENSTAGVDVIPANVAGAQFLKDIVGDYFERHIERLFVGQTLSSGTEGNGLGGAGVAAMHADTKFNLLASDAEDQAETLTDDLVEVARDLNYPGCPYSYKFVNKLPDPAAKDRLEAIAKAASLPGKKLRYKADEIRELTGTTNPGPDDEIVGGDDAPPGGMPGMPGAGPSPQPGPDGAAPAGTQPAPTPTAGQSTPSPGQSPPAAGMAELVAAMLQAAADGDAASVDELAALGQDPEGLADLIGDMDRPATGGGVVQYQWTAAQTKTGGTKAVWSGDGQRRPLYGDAARRALAQKDTPADQLAGPRGAAAMAAAGKQGWEKIRAEHRPIIQQAIADPGSVRPDQLPELADRLKAMTRDELRQMARELQQRTGGKVKQEIVDGLLAHVRTGAEQVKPPVAVSDVDDPDPLDFSTDGMDPQKTTPATGLKPDGATREDRQEYLNRKDAAAATRSPLKHPVESLYETGSPGMKDALESAAHNLPETLTPKDLPGYLGRFEEGSREYHSARRKLAVQLASSLSAMNGYAKDRYTDDERKQMEDAMVSLVPGLKKIDNADSFDGAVHDGAAGMFTGDKGVVTQPGWKIEDGGDNFVVRKAKVEKDTPARPDAARPEETGFTGTAANGVEYVDGIPQKKAEETADGRGRQPVDGRPDSGGSDGGVPQEAARPKPSRILTDREQFTSPARTELVPEHLRQHLNEAQQHGTAKAIESLDKHGGFLLADGTGVGKTRQLLAVGDKYAKEGKKVVIVAPAEVIKPDWKKGIAGGSYAKDGQTMGVNAKLSKGDSPLTAGNVHITTYNEIGKLKAQIDKDTVVLFDESHAMKNSNSQRGKDGREISFNAGKVMYATATPADKPLHIAHLIRAGVFGGGDADAKKFFGKSEDTYRKLGLTTQTIRNPHTGQEIKKWVVDPKVGSQEVARRINGLFDQMTKDGLMMQRSLSMDNVSTEASKVSLPPEAAAEIEAAYQRGKNSGGGEAAAVLAMRRAQEPHKIPATVDHVKAELAAGRQPIVFLGRVNDNAPNSEGDDEPTIDENTARKLKESLIAAGVPAEHIGELHGAATPTSDAKRKAMDHFNAGKTKVLISTLQSGGTGVNLDDTTGDRPRTVVMMTPPLSANDIVQAAGRVNRLSTKSPAKIVSLVSDHPIDQWNMDLLGKKMTTLGAVTGKGLEHLTGGDVKAPSEDRFEWGGSLVRQKQAPASPTTPASTASTAPKYKKVNTRNGERHLFTFSPSKGFWDARRAGKLPPEVSVGKDSRGNWEANIWGKSPEDTDRVRQQLRSMGL